MDERGLRALICVLVVVTCSFAFVPASTADASTADVSRAALQSDSDDQLQLEDADQIHIDVAIAENGTAQVTVDYQFHIDDGNSSAAEWEALREEIDSNQEEYTASERTKWNETLAEGQNRTEREMNITNVSITTETNSAPREVGHAVVTYQWSDFALVQLNRIEAGAAVSGMTLDDGTTLQFRWPETYAVARSEGEPQVDPSPSESTDGSVIWKGSEGVSFTEEQPRLVLIENGNETAESTPSDEEPTGPAMPWVIVVLALALLATVGAVGWLIGRKRRDDAAPAVEPEVARRTDGSTEPGPNAVDGPPPELLSNEERVLRLLEQRGGRVKQQEVVSELEWTEAKTSQVVGDLREDDEIEVFRIGRENVLSLPEEEEEE
ncbi:helix-turn-helix transcriptional regulator [Natrinema salaciae]|uniref:IclR helix-turn-helix domain-containing protein n=1 Tax=Natrinema salaciae TaxID=1186196 RepID=A0A1H9JGQ1_9EURY|nr:hypothetical protein [Natrinema salaciae]SEQ86171.1 hypothetical protein SAMN04489841_2557 [Natrinema salaciae]